MSTEIIESPVTPPVLEAQIAELQSKVRDYEQLKLAYQALRRENNNKLIQIRTLIKESNNNANKLNIIVGNICVQALYTVTHSESEENVNVTFKELQKLKDVKIIERNPIAELLFLTEIGA